MKRPMPIFEIHNGRSKLKVRAPDRESVRNYIKLQAIEGNYIDGVITKSALPNSAAADVHVGWQGEVLK